MALTLFSLRKVLAVRSVAKSSLVARVSLTLCMAIFSVQLSLAEDFQVGDSVVVASDEVDIQAKRKTLGSVNRGTKFSVRQTNGAWLLGEFRLGSRTVLGWIRSKHVTADEKSTEDTPTHLFNWENLLLASIKLDKYYDLKAHVDDYLKTFRADVWNHYHDDEFQLERKRTETVRIFQERLAGFDLNQDFMITSAPLTIGKYDFEKSAFPIEEATREHYWYESNYSSSNFPSRIKVYFKNPQLMKYLFLSPDEAEQFLNNRKSSGGNVNRRVTASLRLQITKRESDQGDALLSEIQAVKFYASNKRKQLLYETPAAPPEAPEEEISGDTSAEAPAVDVAP